jgi:Fe-Mn family superoxide dismutase
MPYSLKQIHCRPWTLNGLSLALIESHYENNYGGALRRLNAITQQLESLDYEKAPGYVINGLKREELVALNSTLLHELYFASMGGDGKPTATIAEALAGQYGSFDRWRTQFRAMGYALGGGSGWVVLTYIPRDRLLLNQYAAEHSQAAASGVPILALDMYEHAYHMDFGANSKAYVDTFLRNVDWTAVEGRYEDATKALPPRPLIQQEFADVPSIGAEEVRELLAS